MSPTWIGVLIVLIGALLLIRGSVMSMFALMLASSLLGGSSAIDLPALSGSSIPPTYLALGFLALRIGLSGDQVGGQVVTAIKQNLPIVIFSLYGALTAVALARLFTGTMEVVPLRPTVSRDLFETQPLQYTSQNVTTAIYLVGSLGACLATAIVARSSAAAKPVLKLLVGLTWGHCVLGIVAMILVRTGQQPIIDLVRNASYAQLTNEFNGFIRITGFFSEASTYASFGIPLLVVMLEAWLRDLLPRWTGPAAMAMGLILLVSTSSTAYLGLLVYGGFLVIRAILLPNTMSGSKVLKLILFGFATLLIGLVMAVAVPHLLTDLTDMVLHMTVDKAESTSGLQRRFWAEQGLEAFQVSLGLGVGAGSFRSSSIITAIIGGMGVVGIGSYLVYLLNVLKPFRLSTYGRAPDPEGFTTSLGGACAIGAVMDLTSALVTSPTPVPSLTFTVLAALAIAFRPARQVTRTSPRPRYMTQRPVQSRGGVQVQPRKTDLERA